MALTTAALHRFFQRMARDVEWAVLLGGAAELTPLNQWCLIGLNARQQAILQGNVLRMDGRTDVIQDAQALFGRLEQLRRNARCWPREQTPKDLPMRGGLFTALGYGFYRWCDEHWRHMWAADNGPDALFCEFEDWLFVHLESGQLFILSDAPERELRYRQIWQDLQESPNVAFKAVDAPLEYRQSFVESLPQSQFEVQVERLKRDIRQGEIYQANLSIRFEKQVRLDPFHLFERLCQKNPSPFSGFFKWPGGIIVSNSPERLVQVDSTRMVQTRPIAGTRGRGQTPDEDASITRILSENPKERAEHLMLVDLARNDLGKACQAGSVQVNELLIAERYSHVTHLVSNVRGCLQDSATPWDVIRALFPGGTITGCPKLRCIEILNEAEPAPRGWYTGSFGYIDAESGALDLNILIRSVFLQPTEAPLVYNTAVHAGAGIVYDAVGAHEYRECLRKAAAIMNELAALEQVLEHPNNKQESDEFNPIAK
ncbi:MAG TPA: anthranilate synthase component I family protein [Oculatellaceae cyanobacterium]|jgi:para-aminobenzoate synthetase component 1